MQCGWLRPEVRSARRAFHPMIVRKPVVTQYGVRYGGTMGTNEAMLMSLSMCNCKVRTEDSEHA